jgi:Asp-tRNA(Asn)/Glu-tRNA(Gln) amidotransferase A subunit family amidase
MAFVAGCIFVSLASITPINGQNRPFDLLTASVADIQAAVSSGALTYERLVRLYLSRIEAYDKQGPKLNAIIEVNPRAIEIARALDEERRVKGLRSPLHGIPIAIKDNIDVTEMPSTGGSVVFAGSHPSRDAAVVERLRRAGAIIFLKTNMDEWALGSRGLSSLGGQILNPYDLKRNPGGSSGGTAVAVNVGFATLGVGTETGFSIRSPASNNALVGIAPTQGLVSRAGVIPISFTQDRVGVHAKSVQDAALLLTYLRGFDPEDLATAESLGQADPKPYTEHLDDRLVTARFGVLRDLFRKGMEFNAGNKLIEDQIALLRDRRAVVIDGLSTGLDLLSLMPSLRVNSFELRTAFDAYLLRRGATSPIKTFAELVASGRYLKGGGQETRFQETMKVGVLESDAEYLSRLENQRMIRRLLVELMDRYRVDALVYPVKSLPAPMVGSSDDGPRDNSISAVTGLPAIVLPAGINEEGLPLALELLGRPFSEPKLIQLGYAYEKASHARVAPKSTPHLTGEVFSY